jgi:cobalt-zinc-cadmium efflux system membrane fusion protein
MNKLLWIVIALGLAACDRGAGTHDHDHDADHDAGHEAAPAEPVRGPNRGLMLNDGALTIELAIFETGVPPEYHAWPTVDGKPVPLDQVDLTVELTRLGDKKDKFTFTPEQDYLRGSGVVTEPHSFVVDVRARYQGHSGSWTYDSFEGRTTIDPKIADAAGIRTEQTGPATLVETVTVYGRIAADPARQREVMARFPGVIKSVARNPGDAVRAGETLAVIESNDSLQSYSVQSPIAGIITQRDANPGEQSSERVLFTVTDTSSVWAELSVFPRDRQRIKAGADVSVAAQDSDVKVTGQITRVDLQASANQSVIARTTLDNRDGGFSVGSFVTAEVAVARREVPLAVKTSALQPFRDFTVVFEQIDDTYEVRMLELGEQQGEWVEVLGGIEPDVRYVTENSYILKADVEKSGASHDH